MGENTRSQTMDGVRGLAMLLVLYGHGMEMVIKLRPDNAFDQFSFDVWRVIASFVVPAFFFVSGLGATKHGTRTPKKILTTALTLVLLADFSQLLFAPLQGLIAYQHGESLLAILRHVSRPIAFGTSFNLIIPWFLIGLAFVEVLAWLHARAGAVGRASIWIGTGALYLLCHSLNVMYYEAQAWIFGLAFFLLGAEVSRQEILKKPRPRWILLLVGAAALAGTIATAPLNHGCLINPFAACAWPDWTHEFAVLIVIGYVGFVPLFALTAVLGIVALVALAMLTAGTPVMSLLTKVGRNTFTFLILNGVVLAFAEPLLAPLIPNAWITPLGTTAIMIALTTAQVLLLPVAKPVVSKLLQLSSKLAGTAVGRLQAITPALRTEYSR